MTCWRWFSHRLFRPLGTVESHVIPAKLVPAKAGSGNPSKWAPAFAGATPFGTFISMGGLQAPGHSE